MLRFSDLFNMASDKDGAVNNFWSSGSNGGHWDVRLRGRLSEEDILRFTELLNCLNELKVVEGVADRLIWTPQPREPFTVSRCYDWWRRELPIFDSTAAKATQIWRVLVPLKVQFFAWLVYQERLLTKAYRARWDPLADRTFVR
ncbi:hypothetical protein QJS10_CPB20g01118 [Acorus calamus]|uniref:Reverse transcriptase zinc-binding domain-containing protein n=1 Tax=Acorus calamus TaxID=4465 RepID=A0AAV9CBY0_ACOCL|nr:hypothetical protein QJS10_CPB20g01118 [Acorus calamus]